jgi:hypothetical protein
MTIVTPCAEKLREAIADLDLITHDRTKDRFNAQHRKVRRSLVQVADMLEGKFKIADPAPPRKQVQRTYQRSIEVKGNVIGVDFRKRRRIASDKALNG